MNVRKFLIITFTLFALIGCSQNEDEVVEKPVPVKIYSVKTESISNYIHATGSVFGDEDVILYSKFSESVKNIFVRPGEYVKKDDVLIEQKNDIPKQSLESAKAALKTAQSQAELSKADFERMKELYSQKAISPQQFDQAKAQKETTEHTVEQAQSMFEQAKEQYENSFIKAPFNGTVAAVYVENNQTLTMGQPVIQLVSSSKMKSKINLTGDDIHNVKLGQTVQIKFPTIPDETFSGKVEKINTAIDQMSKSLEVEITFLTKDDRIKSGMFGEFFIETKKITNGLVIPESSLIPQTEIKVNRETGLQNTFTKYFLFVIKDNKAVMTEVHTGISNDGLIEIKSGLNIGDSVVIVGQNIVKEGQTVNVIE